MTESVSYPFAFQMSSCVEPTQCQMTSCVEPTIVLEITNTKNNLSATEENLRSLLVRTATVSLYSRLT